MRRQERIFQEQQHREELHRQQEDERRQSTSTVAEEEYLQQLALAEAFHHQQQQRSNSSPHAHQGHNPHWQEGAPFMDGAAGEYHHPQPPSAGMLDHQDGYHLADLVGVQEGSPNGVIKYDSPLPLE